MPLVYGACPVSKPYGREPMPGVRIREGDSIDRALKIFKKQVEKAGVISETRKRQHYEKPSVKKKRKAIAARKRLTKQLRKMGMVRA